MTGETTLTAMENRDLQNIGPTIMQERMNMPMMAGVNLDDSRTRLRPNRLTEYLTGLISTSYSEGTIFWGSATASSISFGGEIHAAMKNIWDDFQKVFGKGGKVGYERVYQSVVKQADEIFDWVRGKFNIQKEQDIFLAASGTHMFRLLRAILGGEQNTVITSPETGTSAQDAFMGKVFTTFKDEAAKQAVNIRGEMVAAGEFEGIAEAAIVGVPLRDELGRPITRVEEWYLSAIRQTLDKEFSGNLIINFAFPGKGGRQTKELYSLAENLTTIAKVVNGIAINGKTASLTEFVKQNQRTLLGDLIVKLGGEKNLAKIGKMVTVADMAQQRIREEWEGVDVVQKGLCLFASNTWSKRFQGAPFSAFGVADPWILKQARQGQGIPEEFAANFIAAGHFASDTQLMVGGKLVNINEWAKDQGNVDIGVLTKIQGIRPTLDRYFNLPLETRRQAVQLINREIGEWLMQWGRERDWRGRGGYARMVDGWRFDVEFDSNADTPTIYSFRVERSDNKDRKPIDGKKIRELMVMPDLPLPKVVDGLNWRSWLPLTYGEILAAMKHPFELPNPFAENVFVENQAIISGKAKHVENLRIAIGVLNELEYIKDPDRTERAIMQMVAKLAVIVEFWDGFYAEYKPIVEPVGD